jgi:hypothetical protein
MASPEAPSRAWRILLQGIYLHGTPHRTVLLAAGKAYLRHERLLVNALARKGHVRICVQRRGGPHHSRHAHSWVCLRRAGEQRTLCSGVGAGIGAW